MTEAGNDMRLRRAVLLVSREGAVATKITIGAICSGEDFARIVQGCVSATQTQSASSAAPGSTSIQAPVEFRGGMASAGAGTPQARPPQAQGNSPIEWPQRSPTADYSAPLQPATDRL